MKKFTAALLVLILCVCLAGCSSDDYKKATGLIASKDYAAASEILEKLGSYKDASALLAKCKDMISLTEAFDTAVKALAEKNKAVETAVAAANEVLANSDKLADGSLRTALETAIAEVKAAVKTAPEMPAEAGDIQKAIDEIDAVDYSKALKSLDDKKTALTNKIDRDYSYYDTGKGLSLYMGKRMIEQDGSANNLTAFYANSSYMMAAHADTFEMFKSYGADASAYSLKDYADLVKKANNFEGGFSEDSYGNLRITYERNVGETPYFYYSTVRKGSDAFWLIHFSCLDAARAEYEPLFELFAATIKVD